MPPTPQIIDITPPACAGADYENFEQCIFLGTGTSGSLPQIECLTTHPDSPQCLTCLGATKPEGKYNRRRNTSVALKLNGPGGRKVTVVIDVGKNFSAAALEWFPVYNLRRIDAVLITHSHADAVNGLDDLRAWTLNHAIQPSIDVYISQDTFSAILRSFPYLVSKEYASGGGDVSELKWHIITAGTPFEIIGTEITITPFEVHHGQTFLVAPQCSNDSVDSQSPLREKGALDAIDHVKATAKPVGPYMCMAFNINDKIVYMSDVSFIPDGAWELLEQISISRGKPIPMLVLDCLGLKPHTSHFCLAQSVEAARRAAPLRTYLTGIDHGISHEQYVGITSSIGDFSSSKQPLPQIDGIDVSQFMRRGHPIWMRPAHDGLQVFITSDSVRDSTYDVKDIVPKWLQHVTTLRRLIDKKSNPSGKYSTMIVLVIIFVMLLVYSV